jgi:hypothetical protein
MSFWFAIFILTLLGLSLFIHQLCLHYEVVDFLFSKAQKFHIVCKILSKEIPKNRILLSAHYDSPYEFPLLGRLRLRSIAFILSAIAIVIVTSCFVADVYELCL